MANKLGLTESEVKVATEVAGAIKSITSQAKTVFIDRDSVLDSFAACVMCGEHIIMLAPPGTAKTAMTRFWADSTGLKFWRTVLNPATAPEAIYGALDPAKLTQGLWERRLAGLATTHFALLDEIGKASPQVRDLLLDALEERQITDGDNITCIPLHLAVACSNEVLSGESEAVWDRFTVRIVLSYLSKADDFVRMLGDSWQEPISHTVSVNDLAICRKAALAMARTASMAVKTKMAKLWAGISEVATERISDRRWKKMLIVAAGRALLHGRTEILPEDLIVGKDILWSALDERETVQTWLEGIVNEELAAYREKSALVSELQLAKTEAKLIEQKALIVTRATRLNKELRNMGPSTDSLNWDSLRNTLNQIIDDLTN